MDWSSSRNTSFRYMRCDRDTLKDIEEIEFIEPGGTITYNDLTALKVSGNLPYVEKPDIKNDYLRVYAIHEQGNEVLQELLGTFIVASPKSDYNRTTRRGNLDLYSLLRIVEKSAIREPLSVPIGTIAVNFAMKLIQDIKTPALPVIADLSTTKLTTEPIYKAGTSRLEIVNDLLSIAGFNSAGVNASGTIVMTAYTDPSNRAPSVTLRDDQPGCVFLPVVTHEFDEADVPNVVIAISSRADVEMVAVSENNDPHSIYSIPSKGMEISVTETMQDAPDQDTLQAFGDRRLSEYSSAVESIVVMHPWIPIEPGEAMRLIYTESGLDFTGVVVSKPVDVEPAMMCHTRLRRFVRR